MKAILLTILTIFSSLTFAKDVTPKKFLVWYGVQFKYLLIQPTFSTKNLPAQDFKDLKVSLVDANDPSRVFAEDVLVGTGKAVKGNQTFLIDVADDKALVMMGRLKEMRIIFHSKSGAEDFSLNVASLCKINSKAFIMVGVGPAGCP